LTSSPHVIINADRQEENTNYRLEHIAIQCKDVRASAEFYHKLFGGTATELKMGTAGYRFCFIIMDSKAPIQLNESKDQTGAHHYGFVTDNLEEALKDF